MDTRDSSPTTSDTSRDTDGGQSKRSRRQVAFYPNMNSSNKPQKPFSRSAAKRESVMALGSIEHLQHYFTKTGIAAESDPLNKPNSGMVPAIGGLARLRTGKPFLQGLGLIDLPPSPAIPVATTQAFPPFVKTYETDPENLRPGVIDDLNAVAAGWDLDGERVAHDPGLLGVGQEKENVDILDVLKTTTRCVRSVRNYLVSLPDDSTISGRKQHFRPQTLPSAPIIKRSVSQPNSPSDPLSRVRRCALEVLTVLRALEETARLPLEHDAYDAQSDHGSSLDAGTSTHSRGATPNPDDGDYPEGDGDTSVSISFVQVGGRHHSIPVWDDEASSYDMNSHAEDSKRDRWDERLVLGGGWLYRQDIQMKDLQNERDIVSKYVDAVDEVLFGGTKEGKRGWEREKIARQERVERESRAKGRRASAAFGQGDDGSQSRRSSHRVSSAGMLDAMRNIVITEDPEEMDGVAEEDIVDDEELPEWAKRSLFADTPLNRLHALFVALLPANLLSVLPIDPTNRTALLQALSSGQLLCTAYNVGVRRSRKPWGYISQDSIHDIVMLEAQSTEPQPSEKTQRGWTFRRTDNLQLWAAALKLRYLLPVVSPARLRPGKGSPNALTPSESNTPSVSPSPSPSVSSFRFPSVTYNAEDSILFDAPLVARQESGWEDMLESVVLKWMEAVVDERRGER